MKPVIMSTTAPFGDVPACQATSPVGAGLILTPVPASRSLVGSPHGFSLLSPAPGSVSSESADSTLDFASFVHEQDSGYSDTNPAGEVSPGMGKTPASAQQQQQQQQSPSKRKRVRKSRAKVQDPLEKNILRKTRRSRANDRERTRMHNLNDALESLRLAIPFDGANGKLTKIETLRFAVNYIVALQTSIDQHDREVEERRPSPANQGYLAASPDVLPSNITTPAGFSSVSGGAAVMAENKFVGHYPQFAGHSGSFVGTDADRVVGNGDVLSVNVTNLGSVSMERASPSYLSPVSNSFGVSSTSIYNPTVTTTSSHSGLSRVSDFAGQDVNGTAECVPGFDGLFRTDSL
nr:hypothetical protein BaRGS_003868 [Batillaria attramentaria]